MQQLGSASDKQCWGILWSLSTPNLKVLWHATVAVDSIADSIALHVRIDMQTEGSGGCFTNVSRALQNNIMEIYNVRNNIYAEIFKLKFVRVPKA